MSKLPIFQFQNGSKFIPTYLEPSAATPFDAFSVDDLRQFVLERWSISYEAKRPENARLLRNWRAYDGARDAGMWSESGPCTENRIYEMSETMSANALIAKPRPEIAPRRSMSSDDRQSLGEFSKWYMDTSQWDHAKELATRDKTNGGWGIRIISIDYATGMPYPKPFSAFDYYPDPSGKRDDDRSFWFLGMPMNTDRLRMQHPGVPPELIQPDNIASPSYGVERVWQRFLEGFTDVDHPMIADSALAVHREDETPGSRVVLSAAPGDRRQHGSTTFVLQMVVRDEGLVDGCYWGTYQRADGVQVPGQKYTAKNYVPRSESGFWIVSMTSNGTFLYGKYATGDDGQTPQTAASCIRELDEGYLGLPWVVDMQEQRTDTTWSRSPIDHAVPIQDDLDEANRTLDDNLQLSANPPLVTSDTNLDARLQQSPLAGGDTVLVSQQHIGGTKYLEFPTPASQHFARLADKRAAMRDIVGVQGALEGAKTPGVEAAAAFRHLDEAAQRRLRSKEGAALRGDALLLRKCINLAGKKLQPEITFMATSGAPMKVTSDACASQFDITFAQGSSTVEGQLDREDKVLTMFESGLIDEYSALEELQWPNADEMAARMQQQKLEEKVALASVAASNGTGPSSGAKKPSRSRARR